MIIICECGHSWRVHSDGTGCLAENKNGKVCPCQKGKSDFDYKRKEPMNRIEGIKYSRDESLILERNRIIKQ